MSDKITEPVKPESDNAPQEGSGEDNHAASKEVLNNWENFATTKSSSSSDNLPNINQNMLLLTPADSPLRPRELELLTRQQAGDSLSKEEKAELSGIWQFPDNARGAELVKRQELGESLSNKESAELFGLMSYPHDPKGAELLMQQALNGRLFSNWDQKVWDNLQKFPIHSERQQLIDALKSDKLSPPERTNLQAQLNGIYLFPDRTETDMRGRQLVAKYGDGTITQRERIELNGLVEPERKESIDLQVKNEFPDDPKTQKIREKDLWGEDLTKEESAELYALERWPGTSEADKETRELFKKVHLDTISEAEKKELNMRCELPYPEHWDAMRKRMNNEPLTEAENTALDKAIEEHEYKLLNPSPDIAHEITPEPE
jgi:hypothetical protein